MSLFSDIIGTTAAYFRIGLAGVRLKNVTGNLEVRNPGDSADAELKASKLTASGADIVLDSADDPLTLSNNAAQSGALQIIMPAAKATDGQVLAQKAGTAAGVIEFEFISAGTTALADKIDTTSLAFNSSATVAMFTTGAADVIEYIDVVVDTAFDGTGPAPSMSVGVAGTVSKYVAATQVDLTATGTYRVHPGQTAQGAEALITTFTAGGGASAGAARVLVHYATPA
jgi:hypothetical protein